MALVVSGLQRPHLSPIRSTVASAICSPTPSGSCWPCWSRRPPRPTWDAARLLLPEAKKHFRRLARVWADGGYTGHLTDWTTQHLEVVLDIVRRGDDVQGFQVLPRRRAVERSFARLLRSRRLVRDDERRTDTSEAVVLWSMSMLMSRRLAAQRRRRPAPVRAA
ncbi:hypothetical protein DKG34_10125 [Streptomyces sp. NWU49]|uniref:transposase n=1 Tax=Streptomyces sp. NWU49 TaxID=2201153 RepID=UPI000D67AA33|nr:transposase [Streptomyces sp. NWU49]PWJ07775.1 hypothetical protein DKG34_10125 [Streptomyces sp. NWU49]